MQNETGTRIVDWIDHFGLDVSTINPETLSRLGYEPKLPDSTGDGNVEVWRHTGGIFPSIVEHSTTPSSVMLRVDRVVDFLFSHELDVPATSVQGAPGGRYRTAIVDRRADQIVGVVERHGYRGFLIDESEPDLRALALHTEQLQLRKRNFEEPEPGFADLHQRLNSAIADLGRDRTCDLCFETERLYWLSRNTAARVQLARQNRLGLGWSNHDHHTYRSSRTCFHNLIATLELLGFECRERFYAGREAGWGAQVLEQVACRLVVFADVDLSPDEVSGDFAHKPLPDRQQLGTVGLWCRLHGEAMFEAGMHHLECQFHFERARELIEGDGIPVMQPFTDFSFLKQAFTAGERWSVAANRIDRLLDEGRITTEQAQRFRDEGAIGSHLEILMRNEGYKGFNQTGVSDIIRKTDPRG